MSPILDLQRRLREAGRIRIGDQVIGHRADGTQYTRPRKLRSFRFTSRDRDVIELVAGLHGGTVEKWDAPDGEQWEVVTKTDRLEVVVPPASMALSQFYELWSGGGCQRRCDGVTELIGDQPCLCQPDPALRECKPHTRLSLILPDLETVGLFRLDTQGWNAATELAGAVDLAVAFASRTYIPAELRLELREQRKPGEAKRQFVVPYLDLHVSMRELAAAALPLARPALEGGDGGALTVDAPPFTPVPDTLIAAPAPSIRDQLAPRARTPRANAAQPIPPTGMPLPEASSSPRNTTTASVEDDGGDVDANGDHPPSREDVPTVTTGGTLPMASRVAIEILKVTPDGANAEEASAFRHAFLEAFTEGAFTSAKDFPDDGTMFAALRAAVVRCQRGELAVIELPGGIRFTEVSVGAGSQAIPPRGGEQWPDASATDAAQEAAVPAPTELFPDSDLEQKSARELYDLCNARGIDPVPRTKADRIAALRGAA